MRLSLAGWSLQTLFRASSDALKLVDFPRFARDTFGIDAVELNSIFFQSLHRDYLDTLQHNARDSGVTLVNIAVDEAGDLADTNTTCRALAIANYARWIPAAKYLGINAIRCNSGKGDLLNQAASVNCCIDSFRQLCDVGQRHGVKVLIENHWGLSFDPAFIVGLVTSVRRTHGDNAIGVLADFGNWPDTIDRYQALETVMPWANGIHAKINDIQADLIHPRFDHARCLMIAKQAGYEGFLGIESEATNVDCVQAVRRGMTLLQQLI
jgi:sugar phosphate isomerase/epimerase